MNLSRPEHFRAGPALGIKECGMVLGLAENGDRLIRPRSR